MLLPAILVLGAVAVYPVLRTFLLSLFKSNLNTGFSEDFVGLDNYSRLISDSRFWQSLRNTMVFSIISVGVEFLLGLAGAVLLHQRFRGRGVVRAIAMLPWALPTAVMALAWSWIFNDSFGVLNDLLLRAGIISEAVAWLGQPAGAMAAMVVADVWKTAPFMMIIMLAGMQSIPEDLYEAIRLDGATRWQEFRLITLPLLRPAIALALLFRAIAAFGVFDLVFILTGGGPGGTTETVSLYAYTNYFRYLDFGYGATVIVASFLLMFVVAALIYRPEAEQGEITAAKGRKEQKILDLKYEEEKL
jgi:multiple sugar transport system permease protein